MGVERSGVLNVPQLPGYSYRRGKRKSEMQHNVVVFVGILNAVFSVLGLVRPVFDT